MALIPEDRKTEGLMLPMTVRDNLSFAALDRISSGGIVDREQEERADRRDDQAARHQDGRDRHSGRRAVGRQPAEGGHRQVADEPAAHHPAQRSDARHRCRHQAGDSTSCCASWPTQGAAILFYSTDYDELIGCCDRVLVLYDGAVKRELAGDEITEQALIASALNIDMEGAAMQPAELA